MVDYKGLGVGIDTARGAARRSNEQGSNIEEGDILIAKTTHPNMVAGIFKAEGVVTAVGGRMSHAAVVCLGAGKPAVVGCGEEVLKIKDGTMIEVNSKKGTVEVIDE